MKRTVEKMKGIVAIVPMNLFLEDIEDMEFLEYWEDRLDILGEAYAITFKRKKGKIIYDIFVNSKRPGNVFQP
jgi:hypothetical protein